MRYEIREAKREDIPGILAVMEPFNMHRVPSPEMEELDAGCFYTAWFDGKLVGAAGYKVLGPTLAKTTLLAVLPEYSGFGIGTALQHRRMEKLRDLGISTLRTNADRPETIIWYKKKFGYREIGKLKKVSSFGLDSVDSWTTLETDLVAYFDGIDERERERREYIARNDAFPLAPYPPLIINACLTGMIPTRVQTPHVPLSCDEIVQDALSAAAAGASVVHLHARDVNGEPTCDPDLYARILTGIRRVNRDLICSVTTSGRNQREFDQRSAVLRLEGEAKPDMASLTTGSLNFISGTSANSIEMIERLAIAMKERGIVPELEVFDLGMANLIKYLERNGLVSGKKYVNLLLGNLNTAPATVGSLSALISALPENCVWSLAGLGQFQLPMNAMAVAAGGHVRVGIEDSIYYDYGKTRPATNRELIERVVRISGELGRSVATPGEARAILGLPAR